MAFETTYKPYIPVSAQKDFEELLTKWNNAEKAQAIAVLKKSMSEQAETKKVETTVVQSYIEHTIKAGMQNCTLPNYPEDFSVAAKSTYYKEVIREVIKDMDEELKLSEAGTEIAKATWAEVQKAKTIIEFKKFFKLYLVALREVICTKEDLQTYTSRIEELEKEVQELKLYKDTYCGVFDVVLDADQNTEDKFMLAKIQRDKDNMKVVEALKLKQLGFKESEILTALGIDRNRFKYLKKRAGADFIQGMQDFLDKRKEEQERVAESYAEYKQHKQQEQHQMQSSGDGTWQKTSSRQQTDEEFFLAIGNDCSSLEGV